tara:strand:+ start:172 stop:1185 length:1014 start_codon:yes stop_codon:yes gene_type:complete
MKKKILIFLMSFVYLCLFSCGKDKENHTEKTQIKPEENIKKHIESKTQTEIHKDTKKEVKLTDLGIDVEGLIIKKMKSENRRLENSVSIGNTFHTWKTLLEAINQWSAMKISKGTRPLKNGMNKDMEDLFLYINFDHVQLVRENGAFIQQPVEIPDTIIMEVIEEKEHENFNEKIKNIIGNYQIQNKILPRKLIIPVARLKHISCLILEHVDDKYYATVLDSLGRESNHYHGYQEAFRSLQEIFPDIQLTANQFHQNNSMLCYVHVLENIESAANYDDLIFDLVRKHNVNQTNPAEFPIRQSEDLMILLQRMKHKFNGFYKEFIELNKDILEFQSHS